MISMLTVPTISGSILAGIGFVLSFLAYLVAPNRPTKKERELRQIMSEIEAMRSKTDPNQGDLPFSKPEERNDTSTDKC